MLYNLTADIHVLCKTHKNTLFTPVYKKALPELKKPSRFKVFCVILPTELLCTGDSEFEYGGGLHFQVTPAESETLSEGSNFSKLIIKIEVCPAKTSNDWIGHSRLVLVRNDHKN